MKIILENFGIIERFEFDTDDDFTFIIGANNTGKSYAMTAVYLIIKNLPYLIEDFNSEFIHKNITLLKSPLEQEEFKQALKAEDKDSIEALSDNSDIKGDLNNGVFIKNLNNSFKNSFDSIENLQNQYNNNDLNIIISTYFFIFHIKIKNGIFYFEVIGNGYENSSDRFREICIEQISKDNYDEDNEEFNYKASIDNLQKEIFSELKDLKNIYYLPASRSGIYQSMNSFGQIFAELSQKRTEISYDIKIPTMSVPISDYYINLVSIKENSDKKNLEIEKIASEIENNILNGKVSFNKENKKLTFLPNGTDLNLDLAFTSSMVSEITFIVAYLKYIINNNENNIIMIEEPEAHLHPEVQIELLKKFIELSKLNVKIIITTHSDYMLDQLNNLILSKDVNINKASCLFFKESEKGTRVINVNVSELGIKDENFIYTSEKLYNEKLNFIDNLNKYED